MAEKVRCISNAILQNDNFISLPTNAKLLYVYINNETDDAGFCDKSNGLVKTLGFRKTDLAVLVERGYLYKITEWLYLEKHFFLNNRGLRRDRLKVSRFAEYLDAYELKPNGVYTLATNCRQNDTKTRQNDTIREDKGIEDNLIKELKEKQGKEKASTNAEIINEYLARRGLQ